MSNNQNALSAQVIACNPGAIAANEREMHGVLAQEIFSASTILETRELADGYSFRVPLETTMIHKISQWMANERLCCPFFTFSMIVNEQLWIQLTGTPEVKALIQAEIIPMIKTGDFPTMDELQAMYDTVTSDAEKA